jgi:hypothetical protein
MNALNDFYKAKENNSKYDDVCNIRKKGERTNTNILNAFSGLECPGLELHNWNSKKKEYSEHFKKGKQCLQRRISTMKKFNAKTNKQKEARKKHMYPIQVAYAYAKNCTKKIASKKQQKNFENSVDTLIKKMGELKPDIKEYFGNSIEKSIRRRGESNSIKKILDKRYYSNEQINVINKVRRGETLNGMDKVLYNSLFEQGFSYSPKPARVVEAVVGNNEEVEEEEEDKKVEEEQVVTYKKQRNIKRRTVKKPAENKRNINTILKEEGFEITNSEKVNALKLTLEKINDLFKQLYLVNIRYSLFVLISKNNTYDDFIYKYVQKRLEEISHLKKSNSKKLEKEEKYKEYFKRQDLVDEINKTLDILERKQGQLHKQIDVARETGTKYIDDQVKIYIDKNINEVLLELIETELDSLNNSEYDKYYDEFLLIDKNIIEFNTVNTDLNTKTEELELIMKKISKTNELAKIIAVAKRAAEEKTKLTEQYNILEKEYIIIYKHLTDIIRELIKLINKSYTNPYYMFDYIDILVSNK